MSLSRLALRLAAVEALCPAASIAALADGSASVPGPWPTIAGPRVYDSRIDLIQSDESLAAIEGQPLLIVYTEEHTAEPYQGARYPADEQVVILVVEAMIAAKGTLEVEQEDGSLATFGVLTAPISDREQEGVLDTLESLVRRVLDTRNRAPSAEIFGRVAMETRRVESFPQRAVDRVTRMAARTLRFHLKVKPEAWPPVPITPAPTGLDLLPEPLRSVAVALPDLSSGAALCRRLALLMRSPAPLLPLQSIGVVTDLAGDPDLGDTVAGMLFADPDAPIQDPPVLPDTDP